MSDFGFDAYALDDLDPAGGPHPLKIARDLIAQSKPRSALEVLADHHKRLADDPEYLMLCGEAWLAAGDGPRAQHALLGAIRVAPEDPRPLQLLGDLLVERGEQERARRVFEKAERLELLENDDAVAPEEAMGATPDDLIAAAERKERRRQAPVNPRQFLLVLGVILGIGFLLSVIALLVAPADETDDEVEVRSSVPAAEEPSPTTPQPSVPKVTEPAPSTDVAPEAVALKPEEPAPIEPPSPEVTKPSPAPRAANRPKRSSPKKKVVSPAAPTEDEVEAELATLNDAVELTKRADAMGAHGKLAEASMYYRRALEVDPDYAPALVGMGRSLLRAEKYSEAMGNATRALQFARGVDARPGLEAEALYQIGRVHHQRREEDTARRLLRQSTSLPRAPAEAWFYLGESLSRDNSPAARDAYEQYLERKPNGHLSDRARRAIQ